MQSPERNAKKKNLKFVVTIKVLTSFLGVIALVYLSILSLAQTEVFFKVWNDPETMVWGLQIGLFASWAMALLFQYGQNVALYVREEFLTNEKVFTFPIINYDISQRDLALILFFVFAAVDGWTNIVWFQNTVETTGKPFTDMATSIVGSGVMIIIVFVEELLGLTLQALYTSAGVLKLINEQEKREGGNSQKTFSPPSSPASHGRGQSIKNTNSPKGFSGKGGIDVNKLKQTMQTQQGLSSLPKIRPSNQLSSYQNMSEEAQQIGPPVGYRGYVDFNSNDESNRPYGLDD